MHKFILHSHPSNDCSILFIKNEDTAFQLLVVSAILRTFVSERLQMTHVSWRSRSTRPTREFRKSRSVAKDGACYSWIHGSGIPEIFNSDQGSQFTSSEFVTELRAHGILISMDGRGRCLDNAKMERFWWALKYEDIKIKEYISLPQLRFGVEHYVNFYNSRRIHSALQYRTPDEVYFGTCNRQAMGYSKPRGFTPIFQ